jgi:hypothetical protein
MSAFDQREQAFETRVALAQSLRFKALARRNKLLGLWAGVAIGLDEAAARGYAHDLVERQVEQPDDEALARALADDFAKAKLDISAHRVARKMEEAMARAILEIERGA